MSGGGGGIIIIKNLIDNPGTSAEQKDFLLVVLTKMQSGQSLSWLERLAVANIVNSILHTP